ncbi:MAG: DUF4398 domain-containing protein, partial [Rhodocyclaceae bacterium]|nr:DUF4398 domain-containing protein [Rhodocyclaceae bacterium]
MRIGIEHDDPITHLVRGDDEETAELAAAEAALAGARSAGAGDVAPLEFAAAQEKLDLARAAANERQYERARQVAALLAELDAARFGGASGDMAGWLAKVESCADSMERKE